MADQGGRSREELEEIRRANRRQLGLAGYASAPGPFTGPVIRATPSPSGGLRGMADAVPGGILSSIGPVRAGSAFPDVEYTWDPSQPASPASSEGSPTAEWLNRHVIRPFVEVGSFRYAPGDGYADYSAFAKLAAIGLLGIGALAGAWTVVRALAPRRAANPRHPRAPRRLRHRLRGIAWRNAS